MTIDRPKCNKLIHLVNSYGRDVSLPMGEFTVDECEYIAEHVNTTIGYELPDQERALAVERGIARRAARGTRRSSLIVDSAT